MSTKISKGSIIASFIYEKSTNLKGYEEMDVLTINEVKKNDGYLGHELFNSNEKNIFISYWKDMKSIEKWKNNSLHIKAKSMGTCLLYTSPSPRDVEESRMPSSA